MLELVPFKGLWAGRMLSDAGSIASLVGLAISTIGLGAAIWQIKKLRGETKAASEAVANTQRLFQTETAGLNLTRVNERIEGLKDLHRRGEWTRALDRYPDIRRVLIDVRVKHPAMSDQQRSTLQSVIVALGEMEAVVEGNESLTLEDRAAEFNRQLSEGQASLAEVESRFQQTG